MKTYYLGREQVQGYLRDFAARLLQLRPRPTVWCPMTESGDGLLQALLEVVSESYPALLEGVQVLPIEVNDGGDAVYFVDGRPEEILPGQVVLLFDGAVHSGRMMGRCATEMLRHAPAELCSYSLVIKRGSTFIPTLWGVMIDETDRAYFLLDEIPNNRLDAGARRAQPLVHLQKLRGEMRERPAILSGVPSIDRMTWDDRFFQMQTSTSGACTYVLERGQQMVGFLTLHFSDGDSLSIDEIVVAEAQRSEGYGGVLLRFAETMARQAECRSIRLNAHEDRIPVYEGFNYGPIPGRGVLQLEAERYQPMEKAVLYHQKLTH